MTNNISSNNTEKIHFMLKSAPPRVSFHQDMTEEERNIMLQHIHGLAIIEVENEEQVPKLIEEDPAVLAGIMTTEYYPMKAVIKK